MPLTNVSQFSAAEDLLPAAEIRWWENIPVTSRTPFGNSTGWDKRPEQPLTAGTRVANTLSNCYYRGLVTHCLLLGNDFTSVAQSTPMPRNT